MARALIGVGSNIRPEVNVPAAVRLLGERTRVAAVSTFYRTPAEGRPEQPDYVNGVVAIETGLSPEALKREVLGSIEQQLGRTRTADRFASRTIDLDLLWFDAPMVAEPGLRLPSEDIGKRAYVAIPLAEIAPDLVVPGAGVPLRAIAARFSRAGMVPLERLSRQLGREARSHDPGMGGTRPPPGED